MPRPISCVAPAASHDYSPRPFANDRLRAADPAEKQWHGAWRSLVSAPVWGTGGRGFKSRRSDQQVKHLAKRMVTGATEVVLLHLGTRLVLSRLRDELSCCGFLGGIAEPPLRFRASRRSWTAPYSVEHFGCGGVAHRQNGLRCGICTVSVEGVDCLTAASRHAN
jgi:hypothetical protein